MTGWIKVNRKLINHWLWEEKPFSPGQAWVDLLMIVPYENNQNSAIGTSSSKGEVRISINTLADRWGWGRKKTTLFLKRLEKDKMVTIESNTRDTLIKIVNYSKYQSRDGKISNTKSSGTSNGTTKGTTKGTTEGTTESLENTDQSGTLGHERGTSVGTSNGTSNGTTEQGQYSISNNLDIKKNNKEVINNKYIYKPKQNRFNKIEQNDYDFESIEKSLTGG